MAMNSTSGAPLLRPEDVGALIVQPVTAASVAMQVANVVRTQSPSYRIPSITADASAGWYAEGAPITPSDATTDEVDVTPSKVAGLTVISRELSNDSNPAAAQVIGQSLARDIARKIDAAFFGNTTVNGPSGLLSITSTAVDTGASIASLDVFAEAISEAEQLGATINSFVANPATVLALAKLKREAGSLEPLLGMDPTRPGVRQIFGVPLLSSSAVAAGTVWGIPRDRVFIVVREDVTLDVDRSAYFASDSVGVRAVMRVGFGYPHEAAVIRLFDETP